MRPGLSPESSIGLPYVSNDIGSFKGKHLPTISRPVGAARNVLARSCGCIPTTVTGRQYGAAQDPAADALRLREALLPTRTRSAGRRMTPACQSPGRCT
jgi:hypothetical protein